jgi:hypothetical protein
MNSIIDEIQSLIDIVRSLKPNEEQEKPKKRTKRMKEVKCIPIHNHSIDASYHGDCELCKTHGNILMEILPEIGFEVLRI